ncbi:acyl-CoA thioesterase [Corynebacterium tuberculostearicum]|uniref:Putative acyl-CoA thioesterase II n=1 Tax=Corynebacterium tuberculostearicum SK141 TaxID=553206 RepID=C6RA74_9CORY|nr:acyl-CoA thioesterase domain-containing protein [Corynebacterium tuberculostearicum]EET76975.1 putative acyl-CoA thioesterase II [Corynebacterium tuberculostearicum SK141]
MPSIREVLAVEETKTADVFTGPAVESRIERTFGGQIAAQAVAAAQRTVSGKDIHSLHGYFVGPGDASQPIEIRVERIREGKSFANRQVRVYQGDVLLFTLMASFHRDRDRGPQHQDPAPEVPGPEEAARMGGGAPYSTRIILKEWEEWDIRLVPEEGRDPVAAERTGAGYRYIWFRNTGRLPAGSSFHRAALTYMSDMTLIRSALIPHQGEKVQLASLDHAIWFLRPFRVDEWLLYEQVSPTASNATAVARGKIFTEQGELVALVNQEGLTRYLDEILGSGSAHGNWHNV